MSQTTTVALTEELDRRAKVAALDRYLHQLDAELGAVSGAEQEQARQWADQVLCESRPILGRAQPS
ncbi:MAG: hypothetical protein M3063_10570 [Actinomycetota bacterium]|nr:hypothetical protein [Actinomycetota bacterium]